MRRWGRHVTLVLAFMVSSSNFLVGSGASPTLSDRIEPTTSAELQVWNVSLRLVREPLPSDLRWQAAFDQMAASQFRPDIISVLEVPWERRDEVMGVVETKLGPGYEYIHADGASSFCKGSNLTNEDRLKCGNGMIVFHTDRLRKICSTSCEVKRWAAWEESTDGQCSNRHPNTDQMAVRLNDLEQGKVVTVVSLHLPNFETSCLARNLKEMNDLLEAAAPWRNRPLTIVAGDFNEHPDARHDDADEGTYRESWRQETQSACWYKRFSLHHGDNDSCSLAITGPWSFPYHDAIWIERPDNANGICEEWTIGNEEVTQSNRETAKTCSSNRRRIDYMWLRYETADGSAIVTPDPQYADWQIAAAGTDQGYFDPTPASPYSGDEQRYSDHRALHVRVVWCSPDAIAAGYSTPCS